MHNTRIVRNFLPTGCTVPEFDPRFATAYAIKSLRANNVLDRSTADDIAQDAALLWHRSRTGKRIRLTTRLACRYAVRQYWRKQRQTSYVKPSKVDLALVRYVNSNIGELFPTADNKKAQRIRTILRWLASGASLEQIATELGVSRPYVSQLVGEMRVAFAGLFGADTSTARPRAVTAPIPATHDLATVKVVPTVRPTLGRMPLRLISDQPFHAMPLTVICPHDRATVPTVRPVKLRKLRPIKLDSNSYFASSFVELLD